MLKTKYHGEIEINEEQILHFESGIPGFLEEKQFVILPLKEDSPFLILQSVATSELAFVVTSPFIFFKDYEFNLDDSTADKLKLEKPEDVQVMVILTLQDKFEDSTANLQAPIVVNEKTNLAKQVILNDPAYKTKHKLN
ncbi:flagellar assembly protein FliW [Metabacillus sp. RGM 3146]|uniref:flagellar assembly protein FliW n=1 Tax=Metabacillus sp. RGM 3146 TaxID=3401092 RepID=UPI003B9929D8